MKRWTNKMAVPVVAAASLLAMTAAACAGGFAVREQSAEFQGMSFAGNAAGGGGLSGMFWNPAVAGQFNGITTASSYAYIIPDSEITAVPGTSATLLGLGSKSGNIGADALVPASYLSYQISNHLVFGFSLNSPFGLSTEPANRVWAGQTLARTSEIKTYNGQAVLAYRVTDNLIVAGGVQLEHIYARLKSASGTKPTDQNLVVEADDTAFGWTLGAIWNPSKQTSIGLGWRSQIEHELGGNTFFAGPVAAFGGGGGKGGLGSASVQAPITMPDIVTLSIRHNLTHKLALLGTVEWTNWSKLTTVDVVCTSRSTGTGVPCAGAGAIETSLPFNWHDGWFVAGGIEYKFNGALTGRTGVAWEKSPIQNATERLVGDPDANRIWTSLGATYKWSDNISLDLAYSHIFVEDSQLDRLDSAGRRLVGDVSSSVDIISAGVKIKLGGAEPAREEDSLK